MRLSRRCSSRPLFVCFGLNRSGEVECSYSVFYFLDLVHFQFHVSQISSKAKAKVIVTHKFALCSRSSSVNGGVGGFFLNAASPVNEVVSL